MSRTRLLLAILVSLLSAGVPATGQPGDQNDITSSPASTQSLGYGFGASLDQPFHEAGSQALASLFFNQSPQDAFGFGVPFGEQGCSFCMNILDDKGRLVRRPRGICPLRQGVVTLAPIRPFPLPAGTFRRFDLPVPLAHASSETGDPEARVPFRIFQCTPSVGPLPIRELAQGSFSGYRYNDQTFFGADLVLRTAPAGLQFWGQYTSLIFPPPAPPAVHLSQEMVLVSLAGRRASGRSSIRITSVKEKPCHLEVAVVEIISPMGIDVFTNPFNIVAVPRSLKAVVFFRVQAELARALELDPSEGCCRLWGA